MRRETSRVVATLFNTVNNFFLSLTLRTEIDKTGKMAKT